MKEIKIDKNKISTQNVVKVKPISEADECSHEHSKSKNKYGHDHKHDSKCNHNVKFITPSESDTITYNENSDLNISSNKPDINANSTDQFYSNNFNKSINSRTINLKNLKNNTGSDFPAGDKSRRMSVAGAHNCKLN